MVIFVRFSFFLLVIDHRTGYRNLSPRKNCIHAKAQRKAEIQLHRFGDNLRWKAMAMIKRGAIVEHALLSTAETYIKVKVMVPSSYPSWN